jgi:hypothetical protein
MFICNWCNFFNGVGCFCNDKSPSKWPVTDAMTSEVQEGFPRSPRKSVRQAAWQIRHATTDGAQDSASFEIWSYKSHLLQYVRAQEQDFATKFAVLFFQKLKMTKNYLQQIFCLVTKLDSILISTTSESGSAVAHVQRIKIQETQRPNKSSSGLFPPTECSVTGAVYQDMSEKCPIPITEKEELTTLFQQHAASKLHIFTLHFGSEFSHQKRRMQWVSRGAPLSNPPRSPDVFCRGTTAQLGRRPPQCWGF